MFANTHQWSMWSMINKGIMPVQVLNNVWVTSHQLSYHHV